MLAGLHISMVVMFQPTANEQACKSKRGIIPNDQIIELKSESYWPHHQTLTKKVAYPLLHSAKKRRDHHCREHRFAHPSAEGARGPLLLNSSLLNYGTTMHPTITETAMTNKKLLAPN